MAGKAKTKFEIAEVDSSTSEIHVIGPLGSNIAGGLFDAITRLRSLSFKGALLDLSSAGQLDGAGLIALFRVGYYAKEQGFQLKCWVTGATTRSTLAQLGLSTIIPLFSTRENALRALNVTGVAQPKKKPRELCKEDHWVASWDKVSSAELPPGQPPLNIEGRTIQGPHDGCGKLFFKSYWVRLCQSEKSLEELADDVRSSLSKLWPEGNTISFGPKGLVPGTVGAIKLTLPGGMPLITGVRIIFVGPTSFTFATLTGHMASGYINFAVNVEDGCPVLRITSLARTGDPIFDVGFRLFGHRQQQNFWLETVGRAADFLGVKGRVESLEECTDSDSGNCALSNVLLNSGISTSIYTVFSSLRNQFGSFGKGANKSG